MLILLLEEGRVRLASKNNQRLFLKARLRFAECEPIRLETERLQGKHRNMIHMIIWKSVGKRIFQESRMGVVIVSFIVEEGIGNGALLFYLEGDN